MDDQTNTRKPLEHNKPPDIPVDATSQRFTTIMNVFASYPLTIGLFIRLSLMILLPLLMDDGILLKGVKYTDVDYDVFTDAANHVANGRSPYERHTYRYTPFLASILAWPLTGRDGVDGGSAAGGDNAHALAWFRVLFTWWKHPRYFGRLLFCVADAICGYVIVSLRRKFRRENRIQDDGEDGNTTVCKSCNVSSRWFVIAPELQDALWWLYNPLPINICTRGSAESFVVLLPVLATLSIAMWSSTPFKELGASSIKSKGQSFLIPNLKGRGKVIFRAGLAGILHGVAVHAKLYPIIYTASFMANFSFQEHSVRSIHGNTDRGPISTGSWRKHLSPRNEGTNTTAEKVEINENASKLPSKNSSYPFPWLDIKRLLTLIQLWIGRIFFTPSSMVFLLYFILTSGSLTYMAVYFYGHDALEEGLLYHFSRLDHRHNYSMFWYWIYLARGRVAATNAASSSLSKLGKLFMLPQAILLVYSSLGLAPYDLPFALFVQTFLFVAQNKVITAQYFTWYLCLLPLCSEHIEWKGWRMMGSIALLGLSIVTWLGSAFCLEMLGMSVHTQVWCASIFFFFANVNLLGAILNSYHGSNWIKIKSSNNVNAKKVQ